MYNRYWLAGLVHIHETASRRFGSALWASRHGRSIANRCEPARGGATGYVWRPATRQLPNRRAVVWGSSRPDPALAYSAGHDLVCATVRGAGVARRHILDLVQLLKDDYTSFHFAEEIDDTGLNFDYHIRPGQCRSRNAISLLEHAGYPVELVKQARNLITRG